MTLCVGGGPVRNWGARTSSILKHFDLFSFVGGGPVSKSRCKMFKYFHKGFQYLNFFGGTSKKKPCTKSNLPPGLQCLRKWRFRVWGAGENICNWFLDYRNSVFVSQVVLSMESSSLPTPLSPLHSSPTRAATPPLLHSIPLQVVSMLAAFLYKMSP